MAQKDPDGIQRPQISREECLPPAASNTNKGRGLGPVLQVNLDRRSAAFRDRQHGPLTEIAA